MKTKITVLLVLSLSTILSFGCKKEEKAAAAPTVSSKATLSSWAIANSSFSVRLDVNGANLDGNAFTLVYKCADATEVWCANTMLNGPSDHGTYNIAGVCTTHGGMSDSYAGVFETGGVGTYDNNGTNLVLCKNNGSCLTYH